MYFCDVNVDVISMHSNRISISWGEMSIDSSFDFILAVSHWLLEDGCNVLCTGTAESRDRDILEIYRYMRFSDTMSVSTGTRSHTGSHYTPQYTPTTQYLVLVLRSTHYWLDVSHRYRYRWSETQKSQEDELQIFRQSWRKIDRKVCDEGRILGTEICSDVVGSFAGSLINLPDTQSSKDGVHSDDRNER